MPHGTQTVSKIHLFADLPRPFMDEACRHSVDVVRGPAGGLEVDDHERHLRQG